VITPPGEVHENWVESESSISFCGLYVDADALRKASEQVAGRELPMPTFREFFMDDNVVKHRFRQMHLAAERRDSDLEQEEGLLQFLHVLLARLDVVPSVNVRRGSEHGAVKRVREYIEECFAESISLACLGHLGNLSPFHLHRVFCETVGMPPHAYQTQIRVNRAKKLLRERHPLSDVAHIVGFADQSHLTRHFYRLVGVTPGRFPI
jgi:AraC-like DNA-binding protein